jgi:hypothetical protein
MTVHRDLKILEEQGIVRRVHGGVTVRSSSLVESTILYWSRLFDVEKEALARAAVEMVEPGQAIILDDSTTTSRMGPLLVGCKPLTVITNCLTVVNMLKVNGGHVNVTTTSIRFGPNFHAVWLSSAVPKTEVRKDQVPLHLEHEVLAIGGGEELERGLVRDRGSRAEKLGLLKGEGGGPAGNAGGVLEHGFEEDG